MIGGENHGEIALRKQLEEIGENGMAEPTERDGAVGRLVIGQFAHHARLCSGVRKHVDEVEHHHVQVVLRQLREVFEQLFCLCRRVYFGVTECVVATITFYLCLYQQVFVEVFALLFVLVYP